MAKTAVFFARVHDEQILARNEFYAVDISILRELGWTVVTAISPFRIPAADLYFVWWWTWAAFPLLRARLAGSPIVIVGVFDHILADGSLEVYPGRPWWHRWLVRTALRQADANVFCSTLELTRLQQLFAINQPSHCHCAVDTNTYRPTSNLREPFLLTFCWLNRENPVRKCVGESIHAMVAVHEQFPDYRFVICGEKLEGHPVLLALVRRMGAENYITFAGAVSREEKIELMQRCAIYLQPSRVEGFGLAIAEAMACGAPVITSPVGTVPEVVGEAALSVNGENPAEIAAAINSLLSDSSKRADLSRRGRDRIAGLFSYAKRKTGLEAVINSVVKPD